jgi:hypothetical protein
VLAKDERLNPRTKLALIQNTIIGVPVISVLSIFNAVYAKNLSGPEILLGSAGLGYLTSLIMLYITLRWFRIKSRFDRPQQQSAAVRTPLQNSE